MIQNRKIAQRQSVREILQRAQKNNQLGVRFRGTNCSGRPFTGLAKATVWFNAGTIPGKDARLWRQDPCGAYMYWPDYGNTTSQWGWEVDHITPVSRGGIDAINNLQALHWQNNRHKGDNVDDNYCIVTDRRL
jgi:hypothetical protein